MRTFLYIVAAIVAIALVRWSFFTVDASEYAYVTLLGRPIATLDGAKDAGLHFGWPWPIQSVQRLDRRTQIFDLPTAELLTHEGKTIDKTLSVEAYVLWKIADEDAVDRFVKRLGSAARARDILSPRINSQIGAAIGQMKMDDLVSTDPGSADDATRVDDTLRTLRTGLLDSLRKQAHDEYGVDLIDIRLRRIAHPREVRESIFDRIRSERRKKAIDYEAEGDRQASNIKTQAEADVRDLLAKARFEEEAIKSKADTEALKIRNQAQSQDPEYYAFLKSMEKLQSILGDSKTTLLLSTHRTMFDNLFNPPRPKADPAPTPPALEKKS